MVYRRQWLGAVLLGLLGLAMDARAESDALRGARVVSGHFDEREDLLQAGPGGLTVGFEYGSSLRMSPGTRFRFTRPLKLPIGSGKALMVPARVIRLESGHLDAALGDSLQHALLVLGPRGLRAIVKEGSASIVAGEDSATIGQHEGLGLVSTGDKWRRLRPGTAHVVNERYPAGQHRPIVLAPSTPVLSRSLLLAGQETEGTAEIRWNPVDGAKRYEVQLRATDGSVSRSFSSPGPHTSVGQLPPGSYEIMVRGVDDAELDGPPSPATLLNVVGLQIPVGAGRSVEGAVRLQPDQRVGLIGAQGLEIGYLGFNDFLPAPTTVGLVARRPITLLLRHAETHEHLRLRLEPLTVRAQIGFEKGLQEWPSEGLPVVVKLVDIAGYPVPESFAASCRITVNVKSVTPQWTRNGDVMETRLRRPKDTAAPWVVRVTVNDGSGGQLGRDFFEVGYRGDRRATR